MAVADELIEFWSRAALDTAPFLHPDDDLSGYRVQSDVACYSDWVRAFERGSLRPEALHLSLLPVPYVGDLESADVLVLLLNPGMSPLDILAEQRDPEYRNALIATLRQECKTHMFLDPKWAWTDGFAWWEAKLRAVCSRIAAEKFGGRYAHALADLSRRIACLQLVPYHSRRFAVRGGAAELASSQAARRFARSFALEKTVIVTRQVREWALEDIPSVVNYPSAQARGASLGPGTMGGRAILDLYGMA